MRSLHTVIGIVSIVLFVATGIYMKLTFPEPAADDMGVRMMFRSAHVYILLGGLVNLVAGARHVAAAGRPRLGAVASSFLAGAPVLFTLAFFLEPAPDRVQRPLAATGVLLVLLGAIFYRLARGEKRVG
jgi:Na+-driven multidrug efflux pump